MRGAVGGERWQDGSAWRTAAAEVVVVLEVPIRAGVRSVGLPVVSSPAVAAEPVAGERY